MDEPVPQHALGVRGLGLGVLGDGQPGQDAVSAGLYPPLVQRQPRHRPRGLQREDEEDADRGRDAEAAQPRHDLKILDDQQKYLS